MPGIALALIGDSCCLTAAERVVASQAVKVAGSETFGIPLRMGILMGGDHLGADFSIIRSPVSAAGGMGATYTPSAIVDAMIAWTAEEGETPARVPSIRVPVPAEYL